MSRTRLSLNSWVFPPQSQMLGPSYMPSSLAIPIYFYLFFVIVT